MLSIFQHNVFPYVSLSLAAPLKTVLCIPVCFTMYVVE